MEGLTRRSDLTHEKEPVTWKLEGRRFRSEGRATTNTQGKHGMQNEQKGRLCGQNRVGKAEMPGEEVIEGQGSMLRRQVLA